MSERDWKLFIMDMLVNRDVLEILTYLSSCRTVLVSGDGNSFLRGVKVSDLKY